MARTFQRLEAFGSLTVRDNVRVAHDIHRGLLGLVRPSRSDADALLERVGIAAYAEERADSVPTGTARLLELARCLAGDPQLLLLDEPSSGQDETETEAFGALLRELAAEGRGILMVEHDMDLVMSVCDEIHVLDFGRVIASGSPDAVRSDPAVQQAYLGYSAAGDAAEGAHRADDETRTDLRPVEATQTIPAVAVAAPRSSADDGLRAVGAYSRRDPGGAS
jgi:branched-chain amino acid transport system ATP-binding protein